MSILLPSERQQILARFESGPEGRKQFEAWLAEQPQPVQDSWEQHNQEYKDKFKKAGDDEEGMHRKEGPPVEAEPASKAAASGLYGYTKQTQSDVERLVKRAQKRSLKLAKDACKKDARSLPFMKAHAKRSKGLAAKVLLAAMQELPEDIKHRQASKEKLAGGMYGFPSDTARLCMASVADLSAYMGEQVFALSAKKTDRHERITGFLKEHSKTSRCAFSKHYFDLYPDAPKVAGKVPDALKEHQFTSEDNPNPKGNDKDKDGEKGEKKPDFLDKKANLREEKVGAAEGFDPNDLGSEVPGPHASDADEPWMESEFTQEENSELQELETSNYEVEVKVEEEGKRASRWLLVRATDRFAAMAQARQKFAAVVEVGLPRELKGGEVLSGGELVWED